MLRFKPGAEAETPFVEPQGVCVSKFSIVPGFLLARGWWKSLGLGRAYLRIRKHAAPGKYGIRRVGTRGPGAAGQKSRRFATLAAHRQPPYMTSRMPDPSRGIDFDRMRAAMDFNPTVTPLRLAIRGIQLHACFDRRLQSVVVHA
jgi:hypothetical protein